MFFSLKGECLNFVSIRIYHTKIQRTRILFTNSELQIIRIFFSHIPCNVTRGWMFPHVMGTWAKLSTG
ncbi:hypothetical protein VNO80_16147 [Phaseolus coccineus]|uniref:Uncharacterized protein n=1 Tax=Phaseolus coccineus TaxID=3886 RepID=A0AAN9R2F6_PHACN